MWSAPLFKQGGRHAAWASSTGSTGITAQAPQPQQAPQHSSRHNTASTGLRSNQLCVSAWVTRQSAIPGNTNTKAPNGHLYATAIPGKRKTLLCFFRFSYCLWYDFYQEQRSHWHFDA